MNQVNLIGRITKDPEVRYSGSGQAVARFSVAIDRGKDKDGNDRGADFPNIVCFGKTAELIERYMGKGRLIGITGHLQTGSYEKDGHKIYTTDVVADHVKFLDKAPEQAEESKTTQKAAAPEGFTALEDDLPF